MKKIFLYISITLTIIACSGKKESLQQKEILPQGNSESDEVLLTDEQIKYAGLQVGKVEKRQISNNIRVTGMLDVPPQNLVTISAPLGGFVKHTELLQGMKVKKGQVLAIMEHPDYIQIQQDYLDSKSQLEFLELEYKRQQDLSAENVNAIKAVQQSKSNYFSTKAKVEGLKAKLQMININPLSIESGQIRSTISIISPIDGFVSQVHVNIGMHVNPTDIMFKIVDTEHLHAEAQVFEKDISRLVVGQTVRLMLSNDSKERLATVYLIGKEITVERTIRVHCHLKEEDPQLIPGMFFTAVIETGEKLTSSLPSEAIVNYDGKDFVFIANEKDSHLYKMVQIVTGVSKDGYTEVELPEKLGQPSVVTKGTYALLGLLKNKEE
ncbi:efflux RND transporter periplasmic adaptor subunit [soil metagenome]